MNKKNTVTKIIGRSTPQIDVRMEIVTKMTGATGGLSRLPSCLLSKNVKIKIFQVTSLRVFQRCEVLSGKL